MIVLGLHVTLMAVALHFYGWQRQNDQLLMEQIRDLKSLFRVEQLVNRAFNATLQNGCSPSRTAFTWGQQPSHWLGLGLKQGVVAFDALRDLEDNILPMSAQQGLMFLERIELDPAGVVWTQELTCETSDNVLVQSCSWQTVVPACLEHHAIQALATGEGASLPSVRLFHLRPSLLYLDKHDTLRWQSGRSPAQSLQQGICSLAYEVSDGLLLRIQPCTGQTREIRMLGGVFD